jgi:hypothetical protein
LRFGEPPRSSPPIHWSQEALVPVSDDLAGTATTSTAPVANPIVTVTSVTPGALKGTTSSNMPTRNDRTRESKARSKPDDGSEWAGGSRAPECLTWHVNVKPRLVVVVASLVGLAACNGGGGSALRPGHITDRFVLSTTVTVAGHPIKGTFVVTNPGGSINLNRHCRPQFAVTLSNGSPPPDAAFDLPCLSSPFKITHGTNRFRFTVETDYPSCAQPGGGPITSLNPSCIGGNMLPALPPGSYKAVFDNDGMRLPTPRPVRVTLTP